MSRWTISPDRTHLCRDGADEFVLADTLWAALHRAQADDVEQVLERRAAQGFTVAMMSLLPLTHDGSGEAHPPFARLRSGEIDRGHVDEAWLARAVAMVERVGAHGLTPLLVLQWVNYVPRSWAADPAVVMDDAQSLSFLEQVVPAFAPAEPLWSLSGDDSFVTRDSLARYQLLAPRLRELDPDALVTAHTAGRPFLPPEVAELIDFVGYQSGHDGANWAEAPQAWNHYLAGLPRRLPAMNLEPPYEGHGYSHRAGRYTARHVRTASWRSVITGAGAGLGYGAHGLWSWHRTGDAFSSVDWSGMPFDALVALEFPGAADAAYVRELVLRHGLWQLVDRTDLAGFPNTGARVGARADLSQVVVHCPEPFGFALEIDADAYTLTCYDLLTRTSVDAPVHAAPDGTLVVDDPPRPDERLYVLTGGRTGVS